MTSPYPPPRRHLSSEAASYVRDLIISGRLQQGEFIRLEPIAHALSTSSTPVREGLLTLRAEGFVRLEPRRGFVVSNITRDDILDVYTVQAFLAGELAARATLALSETGLATLRALQADLVAAVESSDTEALESLNYAFHRVINRTADSPKLTWFMGLATRYAPRRFFATISGWPSASVKDHEAILTAFQERDPRAARGAMMRHIQHAGELLAQHLRPDTAPDPDSREGKAGL